AIYPLSLHDALPILLTFLVWQGGSSGQAGAGQASEVALAIAPGSTGFWLERALRQQVRVEGTGQEFGESVLRLRDPDGVMIKLRSEEHTSELQSREK